MVEKPVSVLIWEKPVSVLIWSQESRTETGFARDIHLRAVGIKKIL